MSLAWFWEKAGGALVGCWNLMGKPPSDISISGKVLSTPKHTGSIRHRSSSTTVDAHLSVRTTVTSRLLMDIDEWMAVIAHRRLYYPTPLSNVNEN